MRALSRSKIVSVKIPREPLQGSTSRPLKGKLAPGWQGGEEERDVCQNHDRGVARLGGEANVPGELPVAEQRFVAAALPHQAQSRGKWDWPARSVTICSEYD